jgi:hypothetical protein
MNTNLIIKSAATFRTLGHLISAIMVKKLPNIPMNIMVIVAVAATVRRGRENLQNQKS